MDVERLASRARQNDASHGLGPKRLVAMGYDKIAEEYLARYSSSSARDRWLSQLATLVAPRGRARILDLACGAGIPLTRHLTLLGHYVLGVDASARQIALARRNAPLADFIHADIRHGKSRAAWRGFDVTSIGRHWTTTVDRLD